MAFDIQRIQKSSRKVTQFLRKNVQRPSSNAVHDLRTGTRRLETCFTTLGLDSKRKATRLLRDMADVRKRAGKVRDMDVLTADALKVRADREQDCLVQLLEYLGAERARHARKLRRLIKAATPQLRRNLEWNTQRAEKILRDAADDPARSDALPDTMARIVQVATKLQKPARLNRSNLHPYRLKIKELRNLLQLSDQADDQPLVDKLGKVKDAIGEWHDWEELTSIARQLLDHDPSCRLMKQLTQTSDSKYRHALSLTNRIRSKSISVTKATSAIASH